MVAEVRNYNFKINYGAASAVVPIIVDADCGNRNDWIGTISEISYPISELDRYQFDVNTQLDKKWSEVCEYA